MSAGRSSMHAGASERWAARLGMARSPRGQRWGAHALVALAYALITLVMLWPLPRHIGSTVQDAGDPLFEIWVMRNVQHRLVHDPFDLYDANAFYPFDTTLAYSEEAIATALLAWPVQLITGDEVLAYNAMVVSSFWLLACAVYLLARDLGAVRGAAFIAGLLAAFAPARYGELSHLHMLVLGWAPLVLWALLRALRTRDPRWLAVMSVLLAIQLLSSLHLAVFTSLLLGLSAPFLLLLTRRSEEGDWRSGWPARRWWLWALPALALPYLLLLPTLLPHLALSERWGFERTPEELAGFAARPRDFLAIYTHNDLMRRWFDDSYTPLFPGLVASLAALVALFWRRRLVVLWLLLVAAVSATFALGLEVTLGGRTIDGPYRLLYDNIGPLQSVRAVGRYGLLFAIAVPLLAAGGFTVLWERVRPRLVTRGLPVLALGVAVTALVSVVALAELRAPAGAAPAADAGRMAVYEWLVEQESGPVLELPADGLLQGTHTPEPVQGLFQPIAQMYGATQHWNPTVSGYSGFIPPPYIEMVAQFRSTTEQPAAIGERNIGLVQQLGVRWLIVHRMPGLDVAATLAAADALPQLQRVHDSGQAVVYAVAPSVVPTLALTLGGGADALASTGGSVAHAAANDVTVLSVDLDAGTGGTAGFLWLTRPVALRFAWRAADGDDEVVLEGALPQQPPVVAPGGRWQVALAIPTPEQPGRYVVSVSGALGIRGEQELLAEQTLDVGPPVDPAAPVFALTALEQVQPQRPFTVAVAATLRALTEPPWDISASLQMLDASGARVFGEDLSAVGGVPCTSTLAEGDEVTLTFHLPEEAFATPEARVLLVLYLPTSDYRRVTFLLPDGQPANEYFVLPLDLPPPNR